MSFKCSNYNKRKKNSIRRASGIKKFFSFKKKQISFEKKYSAQYVALEEEHRRRRDECIQLRDILAHQSQSLRSLGSVNVRNGDSVGGGGGGEQRNGPHDDSEMIEAFQAQKLVNRYVFCGLAIYFIIKLTNCISQLESELTALTEESNARLTDLSRTIDEIKADRNRLEEIIYAKLTSGGDNDTETTQQNEQYLQYELQKSITAYTDLQLQLDAMNKRLMDMVKKNKILANRLREHGIDDSIAMKEQVTDIAPVKRKAQTYQGILKYNSNETKMILQRLIVELTPRVAITLLPGLPAYIVFMCIRYTDLLNADKDVQMLLADFIKLIRKLINSPKQCEVRVLWLVNNIK